MLVSFTQYPYPSVNTCIWNTSITVFHHHHHHHPHTILIPFYLFILLVFLSLFSSLPLRFFVFFAWVDWTMMTVSKVKDNRMCVLG